MKHLRPAYHFTPGRNWMNDPNGLVWLDGTWHMYFQYNPFGADWGNMSWGHATSEDLANWREQPTAIMVTPDEAVFSGSVVFDVDDTSQLGQCAAPLVAVYTAVAPDGRQAQALAVSSDGGASFTRYGGNPVLARESTAFRDPKVFRFHAEDGGAWWVMVAVEAEDETVLIYRSDDLRSWREVGQVRADVPEGVLWECPDLFRVPIDGTPDEWAWVLVVSVNPGGPSGGSGTRYLLGDFDGERFRPMEPGGWRWFDHGPDLYAAVSFAHAPDERRILVGWMSNWEYAHAVPTAPWRGAMTLPREVRLARRAGGLTLTQHVPEEIDGWQPDPSGPGRAGMVLTGRRHIGRAARARVRFQIEPLDSREVRLELFVGEGSSTVLAYDVGGGLLRLDRSESGLTEFHPAFASPLAQVPVPLRKGRLDLEVFIDGSTVELFADGGASTMTALVLPPVGHDKVALVSDGGSALVHRLEIQPWSPARRLSH